jgi:hypothetical protein
MGAVLIGEGFTLDLPLYQGRTPTKEVRLLYDGFLCVLPGSLRRKHSRRTSFILRNREALGRLWAEVVRSDKRVSWTSFGVDRAVNYFSTTFPTPIMELVQCNKCLRPSRQVHQVRLDAF